MLRSSSLSCFTLFCCPPPLCSVADSHHFDGADPDLACHLDPDPDPACHFDEDPDPDPTFHFDADPDRDPSFQIKALNLEKVLILHTIWVQFGLSSENLYGSGSGSYVSI